MLIRRNVIAGIGGYGWASLIQLAATPVLIRLAGLESFGLLGFYLSIQSAAKLLDLGISPTVSRELARRSNADPNAGRSLFLAVEYGYWGIGVLAGLALYLAAPILSDVWSGASQMPPAQIERIVRLMSLLLAIQWPITLYEAALTGLRRIELLHGIGVSLRTLGVAGGLAALAIGTPDLSFYLTSLTCAAFLHVVLLASTVRRALSCAPSSRESSLAVIRNYWRFGASMGVISILSSTLLHADKLILSGILPLAAFGQYALASMIASGLYILSMPIFNAVFPELSERVAIDDRDGERTVYHLAVQGLAVLVVPAATVAFLFAGDILVAWTSDAMVATRIEPVMRLLLIGTALNTFMVVPYALLLAHGRPGISVGMHLALIILFLPLLVVLSSHAGANGAAVAWVILNFVYVATGIPITHRLLLRGEALAWLIQDVLPTASLGIAVAMAGWALLGHLELSVTSNMLGAVAVLAAAWCGAALGSGRIRERLRASYQTVS